MKQQQLILIIIIVLAVLGGGYLLMSKGSSTPPTDTTSGVSPTAAMEQTSPAAETTPSTGSAMTAGATKTFTVTGSNYSFDTKEIKVKKGDAVTIVFKNAEGFHDWNLDEFTAHTKKIGANAQDSVTFTADKTGTFEYYCSVGNHRAMGMKGNLIVE